MRRLIFLPVIEDIRTWWLDRRKERERQRLLRIRQGKVRHKPYNELELQKEMEEFLKEGYYTDDEGKRVKVTSLGRQI